MKNQQVLKQLQSMKSRLQHIAESDYPINPALDKSHERRVRNAKEFIGELEEALDLAEGHLKDQIEIVYLNTFNRVVREADFATMEFEGEYCRIALIQNFPYSNLWLIWLSPLDSL